MPIQGSICMPVKTMIDAPIFVPCIAKVLLPRSTGKTGRIAPAKHETERFS